MPSNGSIRPGLNWVVILAGLVCLVAIACASDGTGGGAAPNGNSHKSMAGPGGGLAGVWPSDVGPLDDEITSTIDGLIAD